MTFYLPSGSPAIYCLSVFAFSFFFNVCYVFIHLTVCHWNDKTVHQPSTVKWWIEFFQRTSYSWVTRQTHIVTVSWNWHLKLEMIYSTSKESHEDNVLIRLVSELCSQNTNHHLLHIHQLFYCQQVQWSCTLWALPFSLFLCLTHFHTCSPSLSHSPYSSSIPIISSGMLLSLRTAKLCACVCACNVNEVCTICIFKLVGQGGGEKVTGNEMCLTAMMLLMRVLPRSTPNGMKVAVESKISLALKCIKGPMLCTFFRV